MNTGERIKQCRKRLGLSAEIVAKRIGVSPSTFYRWEKGDIEKVPASILEPLADILQTTPAYLLGIEDSAKSSSDGYTLHVQNQETIVFAEHFDQLPPDARHSLMQMFNLVHSNRTKKE